MGNDFEETILVDEAQWPPVGFAGCRGRRSEFDSVDPSS